MGYGSYRASDWTKLKNSRGISSSSNADSIFSSNKYQDKYNPKFINMRESCDSADSPNSTPIIIAFDVTGSMGYLAAEIAKNSLNKTITYLYEKQPVPNPHIMCGAFTGPSCPQGSLQVTQFEADIRVIEQLLELKVGDGWNAYSYDSLVWYFAAKHTRTDSFENRQKKGFIICIGDEVCGFSQNERLQKDEIIKIFSDDHADDYSLRKLFEMANKKYEIFHIVTNKQDSEAYNTWHSFLPGRVALIEPENIDYLSEVITSLMQVANGKDKTEAADQWNKKAAKVVEEALKDINPSLFTDNSKGFHLPFFGKK